MTFTVLARYCLAIASNVASFPSAAGVSGPSLSLHETVMMATAAKGKNFLIICISFLLFCDVDDLIGL